MMGRLEAQENLFYRFRIEDHVPKDHLLRKFDWLLDFDAIRAELADLYSHTGRPSVDPELMLRMLLVGYLYGIRSERRLVKEVHLKLAYRWFCKLGLEGHVPDRSTFSKNRLTEPAQRTGMVALPMVISCAVCLRASWRNASDLVLSAGPTQLLTAARLQADANRDRKDAPRETEKLWSRREQVQRPVAE